MKILVGYPFPLGATFDGVGTNFSLFSEIAERVQLCLFDQDDRETRLDLDEVTGYCWHGYLPAVEPGKRAPMQSGEAPARSVRQGLPRPH